MDVGLPGMLLVEVDVRMVVVSHRGVAVFVLVGEAKCSNPPASPLRLCVTW